MDKKILEETKSLFNQKLESALANRLMLEKALIEKNIEYNMYNENTQQITANINYWNDKVYSIRKKLDSLVNESINDTKTLDDTQILPVLEPEAITEKIIVVETKKSIFKRIINFLTFWKK